MTKNELESARGEIATFVVKVYWRQNSSWQGTITWCEKDTQQSFRSVLELIKLIDSAGEDTETSEKKTFAEYPKSG